MFNAVYILLALIFANSDAYMRDLSAESGERRFPSPYSSYGERGYPSPYSTYGEVGYPRPYTQYGERGYPSPYNPYGSNYYMMRFAGFNPFKKRMETTAANYMMIRLTNRCQKTTKVMPKIGRTLKIEGYVCMCKHGYYLPRKYRCDGGFYDNDIMEAIAKGEDLSRFRCLPCGDECEECVNENVCIKAKYHGPG